MCRIGCSGISSILELLKVKRFFKFMSDIHASSTDAPTVRRLISLMNVSRVRYANIKYNV